MAIPDSSIPKGVVTNEIKLVKIVTKDGGDYTTQCPHCCRILGIEGEDLSEIRGEQYQDNCGGWFEVSYNVKYVKDFPEEWEQ